MLLLDSEAISAIARGPKNRRDKVRALMAEMRARGLPVCLAAAVLAEVIRDKPGDAAVFSGLSRERIEARSVDFRVAVRAGQLLGRVGAGSEMAVDAFTVAVADLGGGAIVATTDLTDLRALAAHAANVLVADIT